MLKFILVVLWASSSLSQPTGCKMTYYEWCKSFNGTFTDDLSCNQRKMETEYNETCNVVEQHNKKHSTYKLRVNSFFHRAKKHAFTFIAKCVKGLKQTKPNNDMRNFNWYAESRILRESKLRDQGQTCHSCYAMAAVQSVEAWYAIHRKQSVELSPWNVVECTGKCAGGLIDEALKHLQMTKHITEKESPYKIKGISTGSSCRNSLVTKPHFNFAALADASDEAIINTLREHGPIAIAMHSDITDIANYASGVFEHPHCSSGQPDHAVLLVGYGYDTSSRTPYWLIRNSWGVGWGERGHMRVKRGTDNNCLHPCHAYYVEANGSVTVARASLSKVGSRSSSSSAAHRKSLDYTTISFIAILTYSNLC